MNIEDSLALRPPIIPPPIPTDSTRNDENVRLGLVSTLLVAAQILDISIETRFTAACILHRYMNANMSDEANWKWIVAACLFLACKTEEEPRRLRDVINCAHMISWKDDVKDGASKYAGAREKNDTTKEESQTIRPPFTLQWNPDPPELNEAYWKAKEIIVATEQTILRWLAFDTFVSHPHRAAVVLVQDLVSDDASARLLIETAWTLLNNGVFHPTALQNPVLPLAAAAVEIAISRHQEKVAQDFNMREWYNEIGVEETGVKAALTSLKEAEHKVLEMAR